jgi:hypothetical protein
VTDVAILAVKALNGGLFVVAFALVGEILKPKRFAGLFSAAPSVALANLMVVIVAKGHPDAAANAKGMIVGGLALAASCLVGIAVIRRALDCAGRPPGSDRTNAPPERPPGPGQDDRLRAAALPPLRPASFFWAVVPP